MPKSNATTAEAIQQQLIKMMAAYNNTDTNDFPTNDFQPFNSEGVCSQEWKKQIICERDNNRKKVSKRQYEAISDRVVKNM